MIAGAFGVREAKRRSTALGVVAAEIKPQFQGRGLADRVLDGMADLARDAGFTHLIAPVRPSFKDRYPITPIERYVTSTRDNGESFDPWIRVHVRRGARIAKPIPNSRRITGTVGEWEQWTGMRFPEDGSTRFPPVLLRSTSITDATSGPTGSRTSGSSTHSAHSSREPGTRSWAK